VRLLAGSPPGGIGRVRRWPACSPAARWPIGDRPGASVVGLLAGSPPGGIGRVRRWPADSPAALWPTPPEFDHDGGATRSPEPVGDGPRFCLAITDLAQHLDGVLPEDGCMPAHRRRGA
jgi:hypothetical protein